MDQRSKSHKPLVNSRRRSLMQGMGLAMISAPLVGTSIRQAHAATPLVMASWGGNYQDCIERYIVKPFIETTGIPIKVVAGADLAKAKSQVKTGNIEWDIYDGPGSMITAGETENLWEKLDTSIIKPRNVTVPNREYAVSYYMYTGAIGYVPSRAQGKPVPQTFAELWDAEKFPGRRGFRTRVAETFEMALLADGVAPRDMYPIDIERGFAALERIKPYVAKWMTQTPQTISLLASNELDYTYTYTGRVLTARQSGLDVNITTAQSVLVNNYLAVLRGTKQRDNAMKFLDFAMRPDIQASFVSSLAYVPNNLDSIPLLTKDPAVVALMPDLNNANNVVVNDTWWASNFVELDRRFKEWLSS